MTDEETAEQVDYPEVEPDTDIPPDVDKQEELSVEYE